MNFLLLTGLCLLFATIQANGSPGESQSAASESTATSNTNVAAELKQIDTADDAAQADVDRWIRENNDLKATGGGIPEPELERRISEHFEPVRKSYQDFIARHPANAQAHLAYGTFLNARQDEQGAQAQWEKALELDPNNPEVYNNLAGRYSEGGPASKAFEYFSKAIALSPAQPAYYHNFGDSLFVLRKNAAAYYRISEQQVYAKVLLQYSNALRLEPQNLSFAEDLAQTYYSLKPLPVDTALQAWTNALRIARNAVDRENACVHLARVKMLAGRLDEARAQLAAVTNETSLKAKTGLLHSIDQLDKDAATTK